MLERLSYIKGIFDERREERGKEGRELRERQKWWGRQVNVVMFMAV